MNPVLLRSLRNFRNYFLGGVVTQSEETPSLKHPESFRDSSIFGQSNQVFHPSGVGTRLVWRKDKTLGCPSGGSR